MAVRLFIECKFVSSYSVFWFADKDRESARRLDCSSGPFRPENTYVEFNQLGKFAEAIGEDAGVGVFFATPT